MANGGYKGNTPARETSPEQYSGVWDLTEQYQAQSTGAWPLQPADTASHALKLNSTNTEYLKWTPGQPGNRKIWTWSGWVKLPYRSGYNYLFSASETANSFIGVYQDGRIYIYHNASTGAGAYVGCSKRFRDPSAWYHICVSYNTSQPTAANRVRLYVNGEQVPLDEGTQPTLNWENTTGINSAVLHHLGGHYSGAPGGCNASLAAVYFIDGQELSCNEFGNFDSAGNWQPKPFKGQFADGDFYSDNLKTNGGVSWFGGTAPAVFDGNTDTYVQGALGQDVTFTPSTPIPIKSSLRIWADSGSGSGVGNGPYQLKLNGTTVVNSSMWNSPFNFPNVAGTTLESLVVDTSASGEAMRVFAIEVDGVLLTEGKTGRNSYHLDFSESVESSDYGKDRSGIGNHWTGINLSARGLPTTQTAESTQYATDTGFQWNVVPTTTRTEDRTFDANINNYGWCDTTYTQFIWDVPSGTITDVNRIGIEYDFYSSITVRINGTDEYALGGSSQTRGWANLAVTVADLTSLEIKCASTSVGVYQIAINGVPLRNSTHALTFASNTGLDSAARNKVLVQDNYSVSGVYMLDILPPEGMRDLYASSPATLAWAAWIADQTSSYTLYPTSYAYMTLPPATTIAINVVADSSNPTVTWSFGGGQGNSLSIWGHVTNPGLQTVTGDTSGNPSPIYLRVKPGVGTIYIRNRSSAQNTYLYSRSAFGASFSGAVATVTSADLANSKAYVHGGSGTWLANSGNYALVPGGVNASINVSATNDCPVDSGSGSSTKGNYATFNHNIYSTSIANVRGSFSNGNLQLSSLAGYGTGVSTLAMATGKWYAEFSFDQPANADPFCKVGITSIHRDFYLASNNQIGGQADDHVLGFTASATNYQSADTNQYTYSSPAGISSGDLVMVAYDADAGKLWFGVNGTWLTNASGQGNPANGTNPDVSGLSGTKYFAVAAYNGGTTNKWYANFGQRDFIFSPPDASFKRLCTTNFPEPTIKDSSIGMDIRKYSGNGSSRLVNDFNFKPGLTWIKPTTNGNPHQLYDTARGDNKRLKSASGDPQYTYADGAGLNFLDTGFKVGTDNGLNQLGEDFVAWNWAGGTPFTNNAGVNGASIASTGFVNQETGFSAFIYNGTGATETVYHGLGKQPAFWMIKCMDQSKNWGVWHTGMTGGSYYCLLNDPAGQDNYYPYWYSSTTDYITLGSTGGSNEQNQDFICYCWAEIPQYSAFGKYYGTAQDNTFVYTGMRPRFVITKRIDSGADWYIFDTERDQFNYLSKGLIPNSDQTEASVTSSLYERDFYANGFLVRSTQAQFNASDGTYIYAAFGQFPLKGGRAH